MFLGTMCALPGPGGQGKRKEIYKYEAPWTVYSMNWSIRPDKRFRLALGSFVEEYNNKVINQSLIVHWKKYKIEPYSSTVRVTKMGIKLWIEFFWK